MSFDAVGRPPSPGPLRRPAHAIFSSGRPAQLPCAPAWIRQARFAQRPGGPRLCIAMDGGVSSPAAVRSLPPRSSRPVLAAGLHRGCRTNQRRGRLFVGLPQGDGFGVNHLGREGPARADWAALTRSAKAAIVKFVQAVWFVRQPRRKAIAALTRLVRGFQKSMSPQPPSIGPDE